MSDLSITREVAFLAAVSILTALAYLMARAKGWF